MVGNQAEMWAKILKEVENKRYAGSYNEVPFEKFIQSPIRLVPKAGNKTRLIFHLSFDFEGLGSVNSWIPKEDCSVKYNDLDAAVQCCILTSKEVMRVKGTLTIFLGKTDLSNAFRVLPLKISCFCWLVLMARDPKDRKWKFFVDKCLLFGASISCSHYQRFSNALRHIMEFRCKRKVLTNYLDDFLFVAITQWICNNMIWSFLDLCNDLNIPVALEKTEWATTKIVFLGILLNGQMLVLSIPVEKQEKALKLLRDLDGKWKITVKDLQVLTGYLNFLACTILPGRVFTRRIYAKYTNLVDNKSKTKKLKQHHHVTVDSEFCFDCEVWRIFLSNYQENAVCHPMIDQDAMILARDLKFFSDASTSKRLGCGAVFNNHWLFAQWEPNFIKEEKPSIEFLELYALTAAVLTWGHLIKHQRVIIYCDNSAVVNMINNTSSSCRNCMYLLRLLVLNNLVNDRRIFCRHVYSENNILADSLSRLQFDRFWKNAPETMDPYPSVISPLVWPLTKIWQMTPRR